MMSLETIAGEKLVTGYLIYRMDMTSISETIGENGKEDLTKILMI